jgi:hypothetical protein
MQPRDLVDGDGASKTGTYLLQHKSTATGGPGGEHVLDAIRRLGHKMSDDFIKRLDGLRDRIRRDEPGLAARYVAARDTAKALETAFPVYRQELDAVTRHVQRLHQDYRDVWKGWAEKSSKGKDAKSRDAKGKNGKRKDDAHTLKATQGVHNVVRAYSGQPLGTPIIGALAGIELPVLPSGDPLLRASYAYWLAHHSAPEKPARFAFEVAFWHLCRLQADAYPDGARAIVMPLADLLAPQRSAVQLLAALAESAA